MSPEPVPSRSHIRSFGLRLAAGLTGGLWAMLLLSLLDWWLMTGHGGRGLGRDGVTSLCFAFLLLGSAGTCAGIWFALAGEAWQWVWALIRPGRLRRRHGHGRTIFALCLAGGGVILIRFGWMPQWSRTSPAGPVISGPWILVILIALSLMVLLHSYLFRMPSRSGGEEGDSRGGAGNATAAAAIVLLLLLAGSAAVWYLAGPGRNASESSGGAVAAPPLDRADQGGRERAVGPPVILLLLDTLRWDALSCYGHGNGFTPHLDRFCRESVQFEMARAQASWTKPSIATLLTSTQPGTHGARARADRISSSVRSVAQAFRKAGYQTGAVVANGNLSPAFGFARGFDDYRYLRPVFALGARGRALGLGSYRIAAVIWQRMIRGHRDHRYFKRDAAEVNGAVLEWVDGRAASADGGIFLFVNYVDPHDPYFSHPYDGRALGAVDGKTPSRGVRGEMEELYQGEVAFLDHHLGRLFAHLRRRGLYDRSVIVITSDHGEEFLDHGGWWHGLTLFEEQVRVPLMIRLPNSREGGRRAAATVGLIDVAPGLLELAGLGNRIPRTMTGRSLVPWLTRESPAGEVWSGSYHADEVLDGNRLSSLVEGRWKYVRANPDNPRGLPGEALFDMALDPGELENVAAKHSELAAAMSGRLDRLRHGGAGRNEAAPPVKMDEETTEHLRALGYLQ